MKQRQGMNDVQYHPLPYFILHLVSHAIIPTSNTFILLYGHANVQQGQQSWSNVNNYRALCLNQE